MQRASPIADPRTLGSPKRICEPFFGAIEVAVPQRAKAQVEDGPTELGVTHRFLRRPPGFVERLRASARRRGDVAPLAAN